jgi:hypothetical protein
MPNGSRARLDLVSDRDEEPGATLVLLQRWVAPTITDHSDPLEVSTMTRFIRALGLVSLGVSPSPRTPNRPDE